MPAWAIGRPFQGLRTHGAAVLHFLSQELKKVCESLFSQVDVKDGHTFDRDRLYAIYVCTAQCNKITFSMWQHYPYTRSMPDATRQAPVDL